ncbi:MAG: endo-1,4-beta-xylanase [Mangrovibacterium sp.]
MKTKIFISSLIASAMLFASCEENYMDWSVDDDLTGIDTEEIPLSLAEKVSRYESLKTYVPENLILGVGISASLYGDEGNYTKLSNENFQDATIGYAMKHGAMAKSDGTIDYTTVDNFLALTKAAGMTLYGHTLVWHQNQNASYLNGLIAPTYEVEEGGDGNMLDVSGLEDGTFSDWGKWNAGDGITVEETGGLTGGQAVKLIASETSNNDYKLQLITPDITVDPEGTYEISMWIKSDVAGAGRISFSDALSNQYPHADWYATGGSWTARFETSSTWKQVKFKIGPEANGGVTQLKSSPFQFNIDLGTIPSVTYYIDVATISVKDVNAAAVVSNNLISNGDFETGDLSGWSSWGGNNPTSAVSAEGEGYGDTGYAMVLTNPTASDSYKAQAAIDFKAPLENDTEYTVTFMAKASTTAVLKTQAQNASYSGNYAADYSIGTTWAPYTGTITTTTDDKSRLVFDFGATACTLYIDDIKFVVAGEEESEGSGGGAIVEIPKTDKEKTQLISDAMESWIKEMMGHYSADVHAWDVVNEPMQESGIVRDGVVGVEEAKMASDEFYWQKYMGKDYAVQAFKWAREYGTANPDAKLFINDYNLETNMDKLDGLIDYVKYIEAAGAQVDGIGTQMHISHTTDKESIATMFEKIAATGKLVKVSELDVRLGTDAPTAEQLEAQMEMYRYVIDTFKEKVPAEQQYGITIWGISDHENEHEYWLPKNSPNLWTAKYARKAAYKGVADGLAGRDVSEDFSGELQY